MKTLLIAALLGTGIATTTLAFSISDNTPAAVKAAIAKLYPTVKNVKYGKEDGDFEAEFKYNGKAMSVVLSAAGIVKETETTITIAQLPAAVREYVAKQMPGKKIKEAAEIVDANGVKKYEAEVGGKDYLFDTTGKLLK